MGLYKPEGHDPYNWGGALHKSDTSHAAAQSMKLRAPRLESMVFETLLHTGPQTCDRLETLLGLSHQCCSARLRSLVLRRLVVDSGDRALTRAKRSAIVWRVARVEAAKGEPHG